MNARPNIVLVGFMGTGKTTIGHLLAKRLHTSFLDMDGEIERRAGKPVVRIFAEDGEPRFRAWERELAVQLSARPAGLVIGTGGGIVLNPDNVRDFGRTGLVVCLTATPEAVLARLDGDTTRPLLATPDKFQRIQALLQARRPLYEAIAFRVDTTTLAPEAVADRILDRYLVQSPDAAAPTRHKE
jgi:shikimate kinase